MDQVDFWLMPIQERKVGRYVPWISSHCLSVKIVMGRVLSIFCQAINQNPRTMLSWFRGALSMCRQSFLPSFSW